MFSQNISVFNAWGYQLYSYEGEMVFYTNVYLFIVLVSTFVHFTRVVQDLMK
jgi:hypothetical protein